MKRLFMVNGSGDDYYKYLGVKFTYNGHWDTRIKKHVTAGKRKVNSL